MGNCSHVMIAAAVSLSHTILVNDVEVR